MKNQRRLGALIKKGQLLLMLVRLCYHCAARRTQAEAIKGIGAHCAMRKGQNIKIPRAQYAQVRNLHTGLAPRRERLIREAMAGIAR
jgi:hypothetical protein